MGLITVRQLREAGIDIDDGKGFLKLIDNIAFLRGENEGVDICIATSNFEDGTYYEGTLEEAKEAVEHGPYWS